MKKSITLLAFTILSFLCTHAQVVINEIYGGGGNSGATYKNDFIELYNNGTTPVSLSGWSVQYASATGTSWSATTLSGTIPAKGYYLIQQSAGTGGTVSLPTPDAIGTLALSGTAGKVILCNVTTLQTGSTPAGTQIIDLVGFGSTANYYEGPGPTPAPSNTTSIQRTPEGVDNNNNATDFTAGNPSPNNSSGGVDNTAPTISTLSPANNATNISPAFLATLSFSEPIVKGASGTITIYNSDNSVKEVMDINSSSITISGSNVSFYIQGLEFNKGYYIQISTGAFKDNAANAFAGITNSTTWSFTTSATAPSGTLGTNYSFATCVGNLPDGFTQYDVLGDSKWGCTTFGRDAANLPTGSAANGVQINGFTTTNIFNEDWLISPAYDLTSTTYPLLSYWSRTKFNGAPLKLKVSTNYPGTGNPNNYIWTDLNGKFPVQTSDVWTESNNINLAAFKQAKVFIAFVYTSTSDDGARWTLDDIRVTNSTTAPPPSISTSTAEVLLSFVASGSSITRSITVTGNDISDVLQLNVTGSGYTISADNNLFSNTITLSKTVANNTTLPIYIKLSPTQANVNTIPGTLTISSTGATSKTVTINGSSLDPANTLEVVNWNVEWFGSPSLGPANDSLQQANVKTVLTNIGADVYGLCEIVSETRLSNIVSQMPGYAYVVCNYGSNVNPNISSPSSLADVQKEAFIYKTSVLSNVTATPLLTQGINSVADVTNPAYSYFASGRFPYMLTADVTLNGITKKIRFVLIHAKANTSPTITSYNRRKLSADTLYKTLNTLYPSDNIILLGDFNDDLDSTITDGILPKISSYSTFMNDNTNYYSPTLSLSLAGKKSTASYNDMIDHVVLSNEMKPYYLDGSATVLTDVAATIVNYSTTTGDHYPIFTRYNLNSTVVPVILTEFDVVKEGKSARLNWSTSQEINNKEYQVERSIDGVNYVNIGTVAGKGTVSTPTDYVWYDLAPVTGRNYYRLRQMDFDGKNSLSPIRWVTFGTEFSISISPNPVQDVVTIRSTGLNTAQKATVIVTDMSGKIVLTLAESISTDNPIKLNLSSLAGGLYMVQVKTDGIQQSKLMLVE